MTTEPIKSLEGLKVLQLTPDQPVGPLFAPDIITPPESWRDREQYQFSCFVMHSHEDNCLRCGAVLHYADVYRAFTAKTSAATRRLIPFFFVIPEKAQIVLFSLPPRKVPVCPHCVRASTEGETVYLVSDEAAWNEAQRRDNEARAQARRAEILRRNAGNPSMDINSIPEDL